MMQEVIAIFDIGKTNKKFLLFDNNLKIILQEETVFDEITDDDGFPCDDAVKLIAWVRSSIERIVLDGVYKIKALNFSTYGATLVYLNAEGKRITPIYNYLKPMPEGTLKGFYEKYGGKDEFSRNTASPALDMLNSGLQIYWLKNKKPEIWKQVKHILHLPQFISYIFTGEIVSEYPSIGCHTAMWDFDKMTYHPWLKNEGITLPQPVDNKALYPAEIGDNVIPTGIGIHDSSASLVPYLKAFAGQKFMLVSTGTWAINMNPFSKEPLTLEQLQQDCLCYLSVERQQVKSSRLFLGHIHEVNTKKISEKFGICTDVFKSIKADENLLRKVLIRNQMVFFPNGVPVDYLGDKDALNGFESPVEAYHQLVFELAKLEAHAIGLVFDKNDTTQNVYITGGFVKNDIFCRILTTLLSGKNVFTAEIYNATAMGAAMVIMDDLNFRNIEVNLQQCNAVSL